MADGARWTVVVPVDLSNCVAEPGCGPNFGDSRCFEFPRPRCGPNFVVVPCGLFLVAGPNRENPLLQPPDTEIELQAPLSMQVWQEFFCGGYVGAYMVPPLVVGGLKPLCPHVASAIVYYRRIVTTCYRL